MTVNDIPLVSFFQRVLDPLIIMGMLYATSMVYGEPFTGYSLVLMVLAFFISSAVYQHVDPYRTWRSGRITAYARDIFMGWFATALILVFLGNVSGLAYHYDEAVVLSWFLATPFALLMSHLAARQGERDALGGHRRRQRGRHQVCAHGGTLAQPVPQRARLLRRPHRRPAQAGLVASRAGQYGRGRQLRARQPHQDDLHQPADLGAAAHPQAAG
jgi:hypothetical protein